MNRRQFLRTATATAGASGLAALAGCLGGSEYEAANEYDYETHTEESIAVPLVPVADAADWFESDDDVVFVDTRTQDQYNDSHIADAVFSPAADGLESGDPVAEYDTETKFVTYCVCPHTLATLRGEALISDGYVHTYALDEGLQVWVEEGLPVEGANVENLHLDSEYHTES